MSSTLAVPGDAPDATPRTLKVAPGPPARREDVHAGAWSRVAASPDDGASAGRHAARALRTLARLEAAFSVRRSAR